MDGAGEHGRRRRLQGVGWSAALAVAGLLVAGLLLHDSAWLRAGGGSSYCAFAPAYSCTPALTSAWATFLGVPLPVLAAAFYMAVLVLVLSTARRRAAEGERMRLASVRALCLVYVGASAYSLFLGQVLLFHLTTPCVFCMVLHGINFAALAHACWLRPHLSDLWRRPRAAVVEMLRSRPLWDGALFFVVALVLLTFSYHGAVARMTQVDQAAQREQGEKVASELSRYGSAVLDLGDLPRRGPKDAPVALVVFSDFECSFCGRFAEQLLEIHARYPLEVAVYFAHFPLNSACNPRSSAMHPSACLAAYAGHCAGPAFWALHDLAFATFRERDAHGGREVLNDDTLRAWALQVGLDAPAFLRCVHHPATRAQVMAQVEQGLAQGIVSVPTWFINGHRMSGAQGAAFIEPLVERLLVLTREADGGEP